MNTKVSKWLPVLRDVRCEMGLTWAQYSDEVILALIEVESAGDEFARRTNSQFCGLLQMGALAGQDVGFEQRGRDTTAALLGDGRAAISAFLAYQERYAARHRYDPDRIALLWKGGPGTLGAVNRRTAIGAGFDTAVERVSFDLGVPNASEYIRRFRAARARWDDWLDDGFC